MDGKYKKFFLIFLSITIGVFLLVLLAAKIKPPSLDKKNFFTLSAKSPEYLMSPLQYQTTPPEIGYPTVSISPANKLYGLVHLIREWEITKKKYDDVFYASKRLAELTKWGKEISWKKQLISYQKSMNLAVDSYVKIPDPRLKLQKLSELNGYLLNHRVKVDRLIYESEKPDDEMNDLRTLADTIFEDLFQRLSLYVPPYNNGSIIYPLFDPLLDREFGIYEGQLVVDNASSGNISDINITGRNNFYYWPNPVPGEKPKLNWEIELDPNDNPQYVAEIPALPGRTLVIINFKFEKYRIAEIIDSSEGQETVLLSQVLFPRTRKDTFRRIIDIPIHESGNSKFKFVIHTFDLSLHDARNETPDISLELYPLLKSDPQLLITKKSISSQYEPTFSLTSHGLFEYKLDVGNTSYFNGREIRYNLGPGWVIDTNKIVTFLPGAILFRLFLISLFLTLFYCVCFIKKTPLDLYLLAKGKTIVTILGRLISKLYSIPKKIFTHLRLWFFAATILLMFFETFLHDESSDILIFVSVILWTLTTIGYGLESYFSFVFSFVFLGSTVTFLFFKAELVADKLAIWSIIFLIIGVFKVLFEIMNPRVKRNDLRNVGLNIIKDWEKNWDFIIRILQKLKPKLTTRRDKIILFLKILIIFFIIITGVVIRNAYRKHVERLNLIPYIQKIEPKIVYPSTKFILYGRSFGSPSNNKTTLSSSKGPLVPDSLTDSKIYFTVPLSWKPGYVNIWVEKRTEYDGKKFTAVSKTFRVRVIPRGDSFTPLDDLFFKELKTLDKETLKLNGYE